MKSKIMGFTLGIRRRIRSIALMLIAAAAFAAGKADAQEAGSLEIGANYNYVHANAPPGGCGCFSLHGGSLWASYDITRRTALVGELAIQHSASIGTSSEDLQLISYAIGPRYAFVRRGRLRLFGQALIGGSHAGGSFAPGVGGFPGSANSFTLLAGGGVDIGLKRHISFRAFQSDYYLTHFANGVNNHQNNLRISAGLFFHWDPK